MDFILKENYLELEKRPDTYVFPFILRKDTSGDISLTIAELYSLGKITNRAIEILEKEKTE